MIERALHTGNLTAAFAVIATTADMTFAAGAGTFFGGALSGTALIKTADKAVKKAATQVAADLDIAIENSHLTRDQRKWLHQLLAAYPPLDADFPAADMNGGKLTELMVARIRATAIDTEHKSASALDAYRRVMPTVFQEAISHDIASNESQSNMLAHLVAQANASAKADELRAAGVTEDAIVGLAKSILPDVDDVGQAWVELQNAMEIAVRVQAEGHVKSNHGDFVDTVLARVAALAKVGDYRAAGAEIDDALAQAEAQTARLLDQGVDVALLDRDTAKAALLLVRKADVDAGGMATFEDLRSLQDSYYERGRDKGRNLDSALAIDLAELVLSRANGPDERGTAGNDLGMALATLGERETDTARLEQAVTAFEAALDERTRDRVPMQWAMTQMNLGNALLNLGERETGTARLEQAVTAYEAALQESTRDRVPLDWATTQMNLGNALATLGARETGTARLEQAITAYEAALEELTHEREPLDWAMAQMNFGTALQTLGSRKTGTARLEQAATAHEAALEERTRDRVPLDWAITQGNLANLEIAMFSKTRSAKHLDPAMIYATAAREVFAQAQASQYLQMIDSIISTITALREGRT